MQLRDIPVQWGAAAGFCIVTLTGAVAYRYWPRAEAESPPVSPGASTPVAVNPLGDEAESVRPPVSPGASTPVAVNPLGDEAESVRPPVSPGASTSVAVNPPGAAAVGTTQSTPTIKQQEGLFFIGISKKAALKDDQLGELKNFIRNATGQDSAVDEARSLDEILHILRRTGVVPDGQYRLIINVLENAKLGIDVAAIEVQVEMLQDAVSDIVSGSIPRDFEADLFQLDVLILSADDDRSTVQKFKSHLIKDIGIRNMSVLTYEELFQRETMAEAYGSVFTYARYVFVYVTQAFTNDDLNRYGSTIALIAGLTDKKKRMRIIPVWTTEKPIDIVELRPLTGIKYWCWQSSDQNLMSSYTTSVKRLIQNGRDDVVRA